MRLTKEIYTTRECAQLLDLEPFAIRDAIRAGHLKAEKFGTSFVITRENFREYLKYRERRNNGKK